jgi:parvulin-like peptidyl-prolyl isomerase
MTNTTKKLLLMPVLALALFVSLSAEIADKIIAVVGNEIITERELNDAFSSDSLGIKAPDLLKSTQRKEISRTEYLDAMIEKLVIDQEVKKQGIKVDVLEIEKSIDRKKEALNLTDDEFEKALELQGITLEEYREQVKEQLITFRLISQEVRGEIEVKDEQIKTYYNQHPELFTESDQYKLRHIYIGFGYDAGPEIKSEIFDLLSGIRSQIEAGESFLKMAKKYSETPTAPNGGDLGYFAKNELLPEFKSRVEKLKPGQLSPVFKHGGGVHLILLEEIKEGQLMEFENIKQKTSNFLYQKETMERYDLWLTRLKAKTHIENRLEDEPQPK